MSSSPDRQTNGRIWSQRRVIVGHALTVVVHAGSKPSTGLAESLSVACHRAGSGDSGATDAAIMAMADTRFAAIGACASLGMDATDSLLCVRDKLNPRLAPVRISSGAALICLAPNLDDFPPLRLFHYYTHTRRSSSLRSVSDLVAGPMVPSIVGTAAVSLPIPGRARPPTVANLDRTCRLALIKRTNHGFGLRDSLLSGR